MKKKKSTKTKIVNGCLLAFYVLVGAGCGFFGAAAMDKLSGGDVPFYVTCLFLMGVLFVSVFLAPMIHEAGHLVMGLLTGYEFVSFRVGSLTWVKEDGRLVRKKYMISGTGGQCVMTHAPTEKPEKLPFFWYHFGGVMFNFLTVLLCLPVLLLAKNGFLLVGFGVFALVSLILGVTNILPTKAMGMGNDGYNLVMLKKSPAARALLYKLLVMNAMLYRGTRMEELPGELYALSEEEKESEVALSIQIAYASILMYRHEFEEAEKLFREIAENEDTYELYRKECRCEMLFCMIMNGKPKEELDKLYTKELQQYIRATGKTYITRKRLMYAYWRMAEKDNEKAEAEYRQAQKMETTYPSRGEYISEMALLEYAGKLAEVLDGAE